MRKGYMVECTAWDYDDEHYLSYAGACTNNGRVYKTREAAQENADAVNFSHASEVASDIRAWTQGEGPRALLDGEEDEPVVEFGRRVFKKELTAQEVLNELEDIYEIGEVDDDTLRWLSKNIHAFKTAYVVEVEIEE